MQMCRLNPYFVQISLLRYYSFGSPLEPSSGMTKCTMVLDRLYICMMARARGRGDRRNGKRRRKEGEQPGRGKRQGERKGGGGERREGEGGERRGGGVGERGRDGGERNGGM